MRGVSEKRVFFSVPRLAASTGRLLCSHKIEKKSKKNFRRQRITRKYNARCTHWQQWPGQMQTNVFERNFYCWISLRHSGRHVLVARSLARYGPPKTSSSVRNFEKAAEAAIQNNKLEGILRSNQVISREE